MKKQDKDKWIESVIGSLDNVQRPNAAEHVYTALEKKINSGKVFSMPATVPLRWVSVAAAVIIMLVSVNFYMIRHDSRTGFGQNKIDKLARYYQLTDNNPLYNL